jgi:hypothetical protein
MFFEVGSGSGPEPDRICNNREGGQNVTFKGGGGEIIFTD